MHLLITSVRREQQLMHVQLAAHKETLDKVAPDETFDYPFPSMHGTPNANHHPGDARAQNPALFVLDGFKTITARSS